MHHHPSSTPAMQHHHSSPNDHKEFKKEFMQRALELSRHAALVEKSGGAFGAVIVKGDQIIGEGYNQVIKHNDPTWHAEMHAIRQACQKLGTPHLEGCIMYTSAECCPMCLAASYWAHLDHIFYAATTGDALTYGEFQDIGILDELRKDPAHRQIKATQEMHAEALEIWKAFARLPDRARY